MDIRAIIEHARKVLESNKEGFITAISIVLAVQVIATIFNGILYTIIQILLLPITHGVIVASLKMVRNRSGEVNEMDGLAGIFRFTELFSTYLIEGLLMGIIVLLIGIVFVILFVLVGDRSLSSMYYLLGLYASGSYIALIRYLFSSILDVLLLLVLVIGFVASLVVVQGYFFATPYLLEQYSLKNMDAIRKSYALMKFHIKDYILLVLHFLIYSVIFTVGDFVLSMIIPWSIVVTVIITVLEIMTYIPTLYLSRTILFEEIVYASDLEYIDYKENDDC